LALWIWFLLFLSDNDKEKVWILSLHSGFDEDDDDNDKVNNFLFMMTWRTMFSGHHFTVGMMLPSWNGFLRSLLHLVVVRSGHDEGLVRIDLPLKAILIGFELGRLRFFSSPMVEERRPKKEENVQFCLQKC
jgi:hypothetical protein